MGVIWVRFETWMEFLRTTGRLVRREFCHSFRQCDNLVKWFGILPTYI